MTKQTSLNQKVRNFIRNHGILQTESHILTALSGGADSVCLLCVLKELQQEMGYTLSALHVHHGIRGAEADEDAAFCQELCRQLHVPCETVWVDVPAAAAAQKVSTEEAARNLRYQALEAQRQRLADQYADGDASRVYIAVAHHQEDQAETVLWNLFRGSGLKGLSGMAPVNGAVIRPLLEIGKEEILNYLRQQEQAWRQDSTNDSDEYTRNRIRHHILGYAKENINEGAAAHISQAAGWAGQADEYLRRQAHSWLEKEWREGAAGGVSVSHVRQEEEILQTYILREWLVAHGSLTDVTARHVEALRGLLADVPGGSAQRRVELAGGLEARRSYDRLEIGFAETGVGDIGSRLWESDVTEVDLKDLRRAQLSQMTESLSGQKDPVEVRLGQNVFCLRVFPYGKTQKIPTNQYTKWINYDKLDGMLVFRTRRTGDYILLPGGGRKTVKSYMIDEKIPAVERDQIPVIAQGNHVLWIAGHRLSEGAKVAEDTRLILEIQMYGG